MGAATEPVSRSMFGMTITAMATVEGLGSRV